MMTTNREAQWARSILMIIIGSILFYASCRIPATTSGAVWLFTLGMGLILFIGGVMLLPSKE